MESFQAVASGAAWLAAMQASNYIVAFFFYFFAARLLSPSEIGSLSLLMAFISIYNTVTMLALNNAAIKFISESVGRGEREIASVVSRKILKTVLLIDSAALFASVVASPGIASFVHVSINEVLLAIATAFILDLTSYYGGVMFGLGLFKQVSAQNIVFYWISRPVAILLMPKGVLGVMEGFLLGSLACLIFSAFVLRGRLPDPRGDFSLKEVLSFSLPLYLSNIIALAQGWLDVLILSSAAVPAVTGSYYLVLMGSSILSILWTPLCSALLPVLSSSFGRNGSVEVGAPIRIMTFIVLPPCLSIAAVSRTALSIVYGGYEEMSLILSMFSALSILSAYISLYNVILQAIKYTKPVFSAGALSTAIYIALLPILTPSFGSIGAATCRAFLIATSFLVLHIYVSRRLKADIKFMGRILLMSAIIALPLLLIEFMVDLPGIIKGACEASAFLFLWILAARAFRPLSDEDWEILVEAVPIGRSLLSRIIEHE